MQLIDTSNILDRGVLAALNVRMWSGRMQLPTASLNDSADPDWVRATKALVDRTVLRPLEQVANEARAWLRRRSLPFPLAGITFIPTTLIPEVDEKLVGFREKFETRLGGFLFDYDRFRDQASEKLKSLFDPADYPADIGQRFHFGWRFFSLGEPRRATIVTPEIYHRELTEFHSMLDDFRADAMTALRSQFADLVRHLVDRLTPAPDGSRKIFRDSLVENIHEFLGAFEALNVSDDQELKVVVERTRQLLHGVNPQALRDDADLRAQITTEFQAVRQQLDEQMVDAPKRRIRRASSQAASA